MRKAANGAGNIRKRSNGTWEARFSVKENGKTVRRSVYGRTQTEVRKKLFEITHDIDNGQYIKPEKATVSDWFDIWLSEYVKNVKQSTKNQYEYLGRIYIKPHLGIYRLQTLTAPMLQKFYNDCGEKLSPKSLKNLHGVLHRCFNQAILVGYIKNNPCNACVLPKVQKHEMHVLENENISAFIKAMHGDEFENLFFIDLGTGMRQGEIIGLTWDCVDFEKGTVRVEKQLRKDHGPAGQEYTFSTPKNGRFRLLKPAAMIMDALKKERAKPCLYE